jgi:hypothetical protein
VKVGERRLNRPCRNAEAIDEKHVPVMTAGDGAAQAPGGSGTSGVGSPSGQSPRRIGLRLRELPTEEESLTVDDVIRIERDLLLITLTAEDVSRLADALPAGDPLLGQLEVEMREQGFWRDGVAGQVG